MHLKKKKETFQTHEYVHFRTFVSYLKIASEMRLRINPLIT